MTRILFRGRRGLGRTAAGLVLAGVLATSACGGADGNGATTSVEGTGTLEGKGAELVVFLPSTSNVYVADAKKGIEAEAETLGFRTKFYENNFDQSQADRQVQQYLSTGDKPAAFLWWPPSAEAGQNSARQLMRVAPLFQFNQTVPDGGEKFMTAYAGHSQAAVATAAGQEALRAREVDRVANRKVHSAAGNLLEFSFPTGYLAGVQRHEAFLESTSAEPFNLLRNEPVKTVDAQGGFEAAMQVIPKYKTDGIDYVFVQNGDMAVGVVKALEQNGLKPGEDVTVIAGNLSGDPTPWLDGRIFSEVLQSPIIEGQIVVRVAAQYIATGKVEDGVNQLKDSATKPELELSPPSQFTYMPAPVAVASERDSLRLWDLGYGNFGGGS